MLIAGRRRVETLRLLGSRPGRARRRARSVGGSRRCPTRTRRRAYWAPNDVLLNFFDELAAQPDKQDMRYVLALLLVRRRVMRMEEEQRDEAGHERLMLYCPRRDTQYEVPAVAPEPQRAEEIQQVLAKLLER